MNRPRASLRARLIVVALLAILPAVAFTFSIQSMERGAARDRSVAENQELVRLAAAQVSDLFTGAQRLHATLKRFPVLTADPAQCSATLARVKQDHPGYLNIGIFNQDGTPFCTAAPLDPRTFPTARVRDWFKRALASRGFSLDDYQVGPTGRAAIVVAEPIGGAGREPLRVVASSISIDALDSIALSSQVPRGGILTVLDGAGTVLARVPESRGIIGRPIDRADLQMLTAAPGAIGHAQVDGVDRLYVSERIDTGASQQPLYAMFSISDDVVFAEPDRLFRRYLGLLAVVAFVSIGIAAAFGQHSVLRPVREETTRTTRELQETEDRYRQLFDQHPHPMWVFDRDTLEFLEVNDAAVQQYGYSRHEFLTMRITDIRPSEEVPRLLAHLREQPRASWLRSAGWRHTLKSGAIIDVEVTSHPFTFAGRNALLVVALDVTDRLRAEAERAAAEQALRATEERMRFALEAAGVGVWESNLQTGDVYCSETCERMHGLESGSFGGNLEAFLASVREEDRALVRDGIRGAIRERRNAEFEYSVVLPSGQSQRIAAVGHFSYDELGAPVRGAGIAVDVTEKRSLEHQLHQAQKMEAIGQLAGGVAHDFNNLLTAIQGYSELLADSLAADDARRADVEEVQRAGKRAAELTRQLLAFSRKQTLSPQVLHVGDAIGQLAPMLRRLLGESIELRTIIANRRAVKFDPGQLDQVLLNLAVNASDAMQGRGILTIETADVLLDEGFVRAHAGAVAPGPHVMIAVTDNGCGMDPETRSHIFEPFFTTKPKDRGTGLGLAMVYGIVKQSGGSIWVYSEVGKGTTFKLYLPCTSAAAADGATNAKEEPPQRGIESILLIEDEAQVREYAARVLRGLGYRVTDIESPTAAVAYAREQPARIDLVLTDVIMPILSGPDAYDQIRVLHPESAVLFMSGYAGGAAVGHGLLGGGAAYLQKPFSPSALARSIREALGVVAAA